MPHGANKNRLKRTRWRFSGFMIFKFYGSRRVYSFERGGKLGPFCIQPHPQSFIDNSWVVANNFCEWMFFGVFLAKTCKVFLKQLKIYFKHVEGVSIKFVVHIEWICDSMSLNLRSLAAWQTLNLFYVGWIVFILSHPHLFEDSLLVGEHKNAKIRSVEEKFERLKFLITGSPHCKYVQKIELVRRISNCIWTQTQRKAEETIRMNKN